MQIEHEKEFYRFLLKRIIKEAMNENEEKKLTA